MMKRKASAALLATSLIMASCVSPNTSADFGGIGQNPCLDDYWKNSKYCTDETPLKALKAGLVNQRKLFLADPNPYLQTWVGTKVPLHSTAFMNDGLVPPGAYVEFYTNGRFLARGELDIPEMAASYTPGYSGVWFDTAGIAPGTYPIVAVLKDRNGNEILTSNEQKIVVPAQPTSNAIAWMTPPNTVLTQANVRVPLKAAVRISETDKPGAYVEFYQGDTLIGKGVETPDGDYSIDFNTNGFAPGVYPLKAVLKSPEGNTLAETRLNDIVVQPSGSVGLLNVDGRPVIQSGDVIQLNAPVNLRLPVYYDGTIVELLANGQPVGQTKVSKDGNYLFEWNTSAMPPGDYKLETIVKNSSGSELGRSQPVNIRINSQDSSQNPGQGQDQGQKSISLATPGTSSFPGVTIPLKASVNISQTDLDRGAFVEFVDPQGNTIGRGERQPDGTYLYNWDTTGIVPGDYPITAVVKLPSGQELLKSEPSSVKIDASSRSSVQLTSGNVTITPGARATLTATVNVSATELNNGAYVAFFQNGDSLGKGTRQFDGSYLLNWNTTGKPVGDYPVKAVLKSGIDAVLAESTIGNVKIASQIRNEIDLLTLSVSGKPGSKIMLKARPSIDANALAAGAFVEFRQGNDLIGKGIRGEDGTYMIDWDTTSKAVGNYPITAALKSNNGALLAQSQVGNVLLAAELTNMITLLAPSDKTSASVGAQLALRAKPDLTPQQREEGFFVEFYQGNTLIGKGAPQSDGSYLGFWDTGALFPSSFPIRAVLKSPAGAELADSSASVVSLGSFSGGGGGSSSGGGSSVNNTTSVTLTAPFGLTELKGQPITLSAKGLLDGNSSVPSAKIEFLVDGAKIGEASMTGSVSVIWDSSGATEGSHNITARIIGSDNQQKAVSSVGTVNIVVNTVPVTEPLNNNAPTNDKFEEVIGQAVPLKAVPVLSDAQKGNVDVEFFLGDPGQPGATKLGDGTLLPDGSFQYTWNTVAQTAGTKDIFARLRTKGANPATLATSPARPVILIENQIDTLVLGDATNNNATPEVVATGSSFTEIYADVTTTVAFANSSPKVEFYRGSTKIGETTIVPAQKVGATNVYKVPLTLTAANNGSTLTAGSYGFTTRLLKADNTILKVGDTENFKVINSMVSLTEPIEKQVERVGDVIRLSANVEVDTFDATKNYTVNFYEKGAGPGGADKLIGTGPAIRNGTTNQLVANYNWNNNTVPQGASRTQPIVAKFAVDATEQTNSDSNVRNLVLINNTIKWIRVPGQAAITANPFDGLVNDTLGSGVITNNDLTAGAAAKLKPDTMIVEVNLTPPQVAQVKAGTLKLGIEANNVNAPAPEISILNLAGTASTDPIAVPGDAVNHGAADGGTTTTLQPGVYRYRLSWKVDNQGGNNDVTDDTAAQPADPALKNLLAEIQNTPGGTTGTRLARSSDDANKGRLNLFGGNIISLNKIDTVNTHDSNVTAPTSIGKTGADTKVNVLSDVNKPAGAPVGISLEASPILSAAQRGVAKVVFYKTVGATKTKLGEATTGPAATYTLSNIAVPESNNVNITYSAELENLFQEDGLTLVAPAVKDEDFAKAVEISVSLTAPANNSDINDGANAALAIRATAILPHKYTQDKGATNRARLRFTAVGDAQGPAGVARDAAGLSDTAAAPILIGQDTTVTNANNSGVLNWNVNLTGLEDTTVAPNLVDLRALLDVDLALDGLTGANDLGIANDKHNLIPRHADIQWGTNAAVNAVNQVKSVPGGPFAGSGLVDLPNTDARVVHDGDGSVANSSADNDEIIVLRSTVAVNAPDDAKNIQFLVKRPGQTNFELITAATGTNGDIVIAGPNGGAGTDYTVEYNPPAAPFENNNMINKNDYEFKVRLADGPGFGAGVLDETSVRTYRILTNDAGLAAGEGKVNENGSYHSGVDAQTTPANRHLVQDRVDFQVVPSLSTLQRTAGLTVSFHLLDNSGDAANAGNLANEVVGGVGQTAYNQNDVVFNGVGAFMAKDDARSVAIVKTNTGTFLFRGKEISINLLDPEKTIYAVDATNKINKIKIGPVPPGGNNSTLIDVGNVRNAASKTAPSLSLAKDPSTGRVFFISKFTANPADNDVSARLIEWNPRMGPALGYVDKGQIQVGGFTLSTNVTRLGFTGVAHGSALYMSYSGSTSEGGLKIHRINKATGAVLSTIEKGAGLTIAGGADVAQLSNNEGDISFDPVTGLMYVTVGEKVYRSTAIVNATTTAIELNLLTSRVGNVTGLGFSNDGNGLFEFESGDLKQNGVTRGSFALQDDMTSGHDIP